MSFQCSLIKVRILLAGFSRIFTQNSTDGITGNIIWSGNLLIEPVTQYHMLRMVLSSQETKFRRHIIPLDQFNRRFTRQLIICDFIR